MAEPIRAASISISRCEHGTIFIHLHDGAGSVFAVAPMDVHVAADVLEDLGDQVEAVVNALLADTAPKAPGVH
ncbi:hypothetical protein [Phenylobacterium sp.]|uniref:hypothetical protein n=1 Tax=Phenylobacterium sp. TaxID=1871053 RepID=UPI003936F641